MLLVGDRIKFEHQGELATATVVDARENNVNGNMNYMVDFGDGESTLLLNDKNVEITNLDFDLDF